MSRTYTLDLPDETLKDLMVLTAKYGNYWNIPRGELDGFNQRHGQVMMDAFFKAALATPNTPGGTE